MNLKLKNTIYASVRLINKIFSRFGFRIEVSNRTVEISTPDFLNSISPELNILDLGSESYTGDFDNTYKRLAKNNFAKIYCVDGLSNENLKGVAQGKSQWVTLDSFVGDGSEHTFFECDPQSGSGIFPPDEQLWDDIGFPHRAVNSFKVKTKTLDELIPDTEKLDLVKMDIQGAEKLTLAASPKTVKNSLVIQTEVDFIPLFKGTPLFAEVIDFFDEIGFRLFTFGGLGLTSLGDVKRYPHGGTSMFKSDYYYSRNLAYALCVFMKKNYETTEDAERAARTMHSCYHAYDVACSLLQEYHSSAYPKYRDLLKRHRLLD